MSHALAMSLRRMYWTGVYIDGKKFTAMRTKVYKERKESFSVLLKYAKQFGMDKDFTAKDAQLREYVYGSNGVGLEIESYTKGGLPSVSVKHLKEYKDHKPYVSELLMQYILHYPTFYYCIYYAKQLFNQIGDNVVSMETKPLYYFHLVS